MTTKIARRDFLKGMGAIGIAIAVSPFEAFSEPKRDEFTIVSTVPKSDLAYLEDILIPDDAKPDSASSPDTGAMPLMIDRWPEIAYYIDVRGQLDNARADITLNYLGNAFILNKSGFFTSAYHLFEKHLKRQQRGENKSMVLVYDPETGIASTAKALIFSEKYDVLLGRVGLDGGLNIKTTHISDKASPLYGVVYSTRYKNLDYISGDLFEEVLHSGSFGIEPGKEKTAWFRQGELLKKKLDKELGCCVELGRPEDIIFKDREKLAKTWEYVFLSKTVPGNSGSPVFDLQNNLTGIVTRSSSVRDTDTEEICPVGIYTGTLKIREMIRGYISYHRRQGYG